MHHAITASTLLLMTLTVPLASKAESTSSDSLRWQPLPPLPDPHGFACPVVGTLDDCPVVAGGSNFPNAPLWEKGVKVWHDQVFLSDPKASAWHVVGRLPRAIVYAVSVSVDNAIFIVGGQDGENVSSEVLRLRLLEGKLEFDTPLPPLPEPLSMAAGCLVDRVIYLAGGVNSVENPEPTRAFYSLDLDAEKPVWNQLAPWPGPPRCLAAVGARNGELILVGGLSRMKDIQADDYLLDAYAFNPVTGWSVLPTLLQPAAAAASPMPTAPDGTLMLINPLFPALRSSHGVSGASRQKQIPSSSQSQ